MNPTRSAVTHRTTSMAMVAVALLLGTSTFLTMPRREDPEIVIRSALIVTKWPGATAAKIEELVTDPIEQAVHRMNETFKITSQSKTDVSIIIVELLETLPKREVDQAWDVLRSRVAEVRGQLPQGCRDPEINTDFGDVFGVCLALYQRPPEGQERVPEAYRYSWRELEVLAERVETELKSLPAVAKVDKLGIQDEVIYVEVPGEAWAKISLTEEQLAQLMDAQNIVAPGGQLDTGAIRYAVRPTGEFEAYQSMNDIVVGLRDLRLPVFLRDLPVEIRRTSVDPPAQKYRYATPDVRSDRMLLLAVSMKSGENLVDLGEAVHTKLAELEAGVLPYDVSLDLVNDLPRQVDTLIGNFVTNLWQAIALVMAVAFLMMGWRPALIMATAVPLSMVASLTVVRGFGVELEQFSIASLIIALGMIVDNAIVVSDNAVRMIEAGKSRIDAVVEGATSLAVPILTSTLTTVAAFLPMLTIVGSTGEYVRSLPIVVATTLLMSYVIAMFVTPIMCFWLLPPRTHAHTKTLVERIAGLFRREGGQAPAAAGGGLYDRLIGFCLDHKGLVLALAATGVVASLSLVPLIGNQFFPLGDRDQFFVHVWLPEGASIHATEDACRQVEDLILETRMGDVDGVRRDRLRNLVAMVGTGGPRLMLTTNPEQNFPNYAHILVNTTDPKCSAAWVEELRARVKDIAGAQITVRRFLLGPYVKQPIEFRLSSDDADVLRAKAEEAVSILRDTRGTLNPESDWKNPSYEVEVKIDPEAANLAGVTNLDVASTMGGLISGRQLTTFREGDHLIPVYLRMKAEERGRLAELGKLYVNGRAGKVPLTSIAELVPGWQPAVIARYNRRRTVSVGAQAAEGYLPTEVARAAAPRFDELVKTMPPGSRWEFGGELEQAELGQQKLSSAFSLSAVLILLVLISQYNSLVKPLVVLATIPLSLIGALLGLFLTGWPLGFMPLLGIISLAGVVINNAIILIDFIEAGVREGMTLRDSLIQAGRQRMRPILLTTLTTIGGMLPLALFGGPLWAGMAWAVIFGLACSTGLTLLVTPTLYMACLGRRHARAAAASSADSGPAGEA